MVLQALIIISIVLQAVAVTVAVRLMRRTKYNFSWILFTIALTALIITRLAEYYQQIASRELRLPPDFFVWIGVITSLCFAIGMLYVKKIFKYIGDMYFQRQLAEKRILNTILRTEEKERMRFSKELHDGLGPLLSSARMSLSAIDPEKLNWEERELIENTVAVVDEAVGSLREISNNLSPHTLQDFGLTKAVKNFISRSSTGGHITINFSTNLTVERFDADLEIILYRVICELINNSIKHSGGSEINLALTHGHESIFIDYSDNGRGFDSEAVIDVGMGLSNITSRINSLKGKTAISSTRNEGMNARITVPIVKDKEWRRANL